MIYAGHGHYAIIDIQDYEKSRATIALMNELAKGKKSGEEKGWLSAEAVRAHFRSKRDEVQNTVFSGGTE